MSYCFKIQASIHIEKIAMCFKLQLAFERQNGKLFQMFKETTNAFNKM